ncbi:MAG TPA: class I SAM-dependent methyltransferase [Mycobacteriales bacterium]
MSRPRYGVDGWPYLAGLAAATAALGSAALAAPRLRKAAGAAALVPGVPAVLGLRYVLVGKLRLRDLLLGQVDWRGDEEVVDLGTGTGLLAIGAAKRTRGAVHAVDLFVSKDLSNNGPERLARNSLLDGVPERLHVHRVDVRATGLPDGAADVVVSSLCFHNLPEQHESTAALDEAVRLLRPGGTLVLSNLAHVEDEYAPHLRAAGFSVLTSRAPATFPPQKLLVARHLRRPTTASATAGSTAASPDSRPCWSGTSPLAAALPGHPAPRS